MAKAQRSKGSQGPRPGEAARPDTVTLKVTVARDTARLLRLEAFGRDCSLGRIVEDLVRNSPRRYVLVDRGKGAQGPEVPSSPPHQQAQEPRRGVGGLGVVSEDVA